MKLDDMNFDDSMALTVTSNALQPKLKGLGGVYEAHTKLVFLFDISDSMGMRMSRDYVDHYIWPDTMLADVRKKALATFEGIIEKRLEALMSDAPPVVLSNVDTFLLSIIDPMTGNVEPDDKKLQQAMIRHTVVLELGGTINLAKHKDVPMSRAQVVKQIAVKEIGRRLDENPDAAIAVVFFNSNAKVVFNEGDLRRGIDQSTGRQLARVQLEKAIAEVDKVCGGTNILDALTKGLEACAAKQSKVGLHHFVLVTDGEDSYSSSMIHDWVPVLKQSGVVLDYIHIGDLEVNDAVKEACEALGGQFVGVETQEELETKFMEAAQRKCLPPAPSAA